jgi:hypothetical protein
MPITKKNGRQELSSKKIHMPFFPAETAPDNPHNFTLPLDFPAADPHSFDHQRLKCVTCFS